MTSEMPIKVSQEFNEATCNLGTHTNIRLVRSKTFQAHNGVTSRSSKRIVSDTTRYAASATVDLSFIPSEIDRLGGSFSASSDET